MRIAAIKQLVSDYSLEELRKAEEDLMEERHPSIDLGPDEVGDQLTHTIAAIQILEEVENGVDEKTALRNFTQRVRNSIN
jgi:hypothetical protein